MGNPTPTLSARPLAFLVAGVLVGGLISATTAGTATAADNTGDFDTTAPGTTPSGWSVSGAGGDATVQDVPGTVDRSLRLRDTSTTAPVTAGTSFGTTSSTVVAGFRLRAAQTSATIGVHLDSTGGHSVTVAMGANGRLYTYDAAERVDLGAYRANRWYDIKVVAHPSTATAELYIDGERKATGLAFRTSTTALGGIRAGVSTAGTGSAWVDDVRTTTESTPDNWQYLGSVAPRTARQVGTSDLIIGAETLDRDYTDYQAFAPYLGRLGATSTRLQGGWAKTEKTKGVYDWTWLDKIVDDARSRGVKPWLQLSYGNGAYPGGGGSGLGGKLPTSDEALAAWDAWVTAMVNRYKNRGVTEWEIWNEPNLAGIPVADYTDFFIRTATLIRAEQPKALIYGQEAGIEVPYARDFLMRLADKGKADLLDGFTYHPYNPNPDDAWTYGQVEKLRALIAQYAPGAILRQGENGAPSRPGSFGALGDLDWTELSQTKWILRRVLNDLGRGISTSVFSISDLHYPSKINSKGLLQTNTDKTIRYAKPSYYAVQNVASLIDDTMQPLTGYTWTAAPGTPLTVQAFAKRGTGRQIVGVWSGAAKPSDDNTRKSIDLTFTGGNFKDPVHVDVRTGAVFDIPAGNWSVQGRSYTFKDVPVYDSPVLIADRSVIKF
ncbi:GH39 family glycosyl hydrolase [Streptomyces lavendulocolor]